LLFVLCLRPPDLDAVELKALLHPGAAAAVEAGGHEDDLPAGLVAEEDAERTVVRPALVGPAERAAGGDIGEPRNGLRDPVLDENRNDGCRRGGSGSGAGRGDGDQEAHAPGHSGNRMPFVLGHGARRVKNSAA